MLIYLAHRFLISRYVDALKYGARIKALKRVPINIVKKNSRVKNTLLID